MEDKKLNAAILVGFIALIICIGYAAIVRLSFGDWTKAGVFGDAFGALNPIFTGLAFISIILNHNLQREDMNRAADRHKELIEEQRRALQLAAYETILGSHQIRLEWARTKNLKHEAELTEKEILDLQAKIRALAGKDNSY